ncbi:MAG: hypothetical protein LUC83_05220 [Clostridiales bacterium]|nr:hypothetical protein [Clostridiales bacterium]
MSELYQALIKKKQELEGIIRNSEDFLQTAPDGQLWIARRGKYDQYYCWKKETKQEYPRGKYIKQKEQDLAGKLAQKSYFQKILKTARIRLEKVEKFLEDYDADELQKIYTDLKPAWKELVQPIRLQDELFIQQWEQVVYKKREFAPGDQEIYTEKGERVLSKSEKILADKFYMMGIPYRYEFPLELSGIGVIHPDFLLLNRRTRKEYYWEHLGMMDNPEYSVNAMKRVECYIKNNIFPGKQLILTYEAKGYPLNIKNVERLVKEHLY